MGFIAQLLAPFHPRRITSLVQTRGPESPKRHKVEEDAAADVERIEQDDKYFGQDPPANDDGLLSIRTRHGPQIGAAIVIAGGQDLPAWAERHRVHA
jgi:hypothetical protein